MPPAPKYNVECIGPDQSESGKNSASSTLYLGGGASNDTHSFLGTKVPALVLVCFYLQSFFHSLRPCSAFREGWSREAPEGGGRVQNEGSRDGNSWGDGSRDAGIGARAPWTQIGGVSGMRGCGDLEGGEGPGEVPEWGSGGWTSCVRGCEDVLPLGVLREGGHFGPHPVCKRRPGGRGGRGLRVCLGGGVAQERRRRRLLTPKAMALDSLAE